MNDSIIKYQVFFRKYGDDKLFWLGDDNQLHISRSRARLFFSSEDAYVCVSRYLMYGINLRDKELLDYCDFNLTVC